MNVNGPHMLPTSHTHNRLISPHMSSFKAIKTEPDSGEIRVLPIGNMPPAGSMPPAAAQQFPPISFAAINTARSSTPHGYAHPAAMQVPAMLPAAPNPATASAPVTTSLPRSTRVIAKPSPRKTQSTNSLNIGQVLKAPRTTQLSSRALYDMIADGTIDVAPDYQREVVWVAAKQSALIESLMRHFYVPPILLSAQETEDDEEDERFVCVDGKQRLSSLCAFYENQIPVRDVESNKAFYYDSGNSTLTPTQRRRFESLQLTVVQFSGLSDHTERDMFSRVQMGMPLTSAEKLATNVGPWPNFLRGLVDKYFQPTPSIVRNEDGKPYLAVDRGKDYLFMTQIALMIDNADDDTYMPTNAVIVKFLQSDAAKEPPHPNLKYRIELALDRFFALAVHPVLRKCVEPEATTNSNIKFKSLSPAEFVHMGFMVYELPEANITQLYTFAEGMKRDIRSQFKDVFMNKITSQALRAYIDKARSSVGGDGDDFDDGQALPDAKRRRT